MSANLLNGPARVRMSASTTLRYAIVEWTGTADSPTKDVVNTWTSATFTPGNFFIATTTTIAATGSAALTANTLASVSLSGAVSGAMNNLHVFFWTDSAQAQNVTLDIGKVQLELGAAATALAVRSYGEELQISLRYFQLHSNPAGAAIGNGSANVYYHSFPLPVRMRAAPTPAMVVNVGFTDPAANYTATGILNNNCIPTTFNCNYSASGAVAANNIVTNSNGTLSLNARL